MQRILASATALVTLSATISLASAADAHPQLKAAGPAPGSVVKDSPKALRIQFNEGIVLDVTPQISDDNIITMDIHPTITERTGQATSPRGDSVATFGS